MRQGIDQRRQDRGRHRAGFAGDAGPHGPAQEGFLDQRHGDAAQQALCRGLPNSAAPRVVPGRGRHRCSATMIAMTSPISTTPAPRPMAASRRKARGGRPYPRLAR